MNGSEADTMLKNIRNLSSNPVILVLFGMLIFVFIFFFGMPSQGSLAESAQVFNEWSVRVQDEEVKVREGNVYAIRRDRNSSNDDLSALKTRLNEMTSEVLVDSLAQSMGWVDASDEEIKYITASNNLDMAYFSRDQRDSKDLYQRFLKTFPEGTDAQTLDFQNLLTRYLDFIAEGRGFKSDEFKDIIAGWSSNPTQYLKSKSREMRIRSYLDYLKSTVKVNEQGIKDQLHQEKDQWRFSYVLFGKDHVARPTKKEAKTTLESYAKEKMKNIESYYKKNIENYSKTQLKFTQVSTRYSKPELQKQVKEAIDQAFARVSKGEDPKKVATDLSKDGITISAFVQSNKTRKNTSEKLFNQALKMEAGKVSEVTHQTTPSFSFPGQPPMPPSGTYSFVRLEDKVMGEEKTVDDVKTEIAQILIWDEAQKQGAEKQAQSLITRLQKGETLEAAVEKWNQAIPKAAAAKEGDTPKALFSSLIVSESADITLPALLSGNIEGIGRDATAADALLNEIFKLNEKTPVVSKTLKINNEWVIASLKSFKAASEVDVEANQARLMIEQRQNRQARFFGKSWLSYIFFGPASLDVFFSLPREIQSQMPRELTQAFFATMSGKQGDEGFLNALLQSKEYQALVTRNPAVERFFKNK
jgi:hypothetical protein